jgi:hypothetical protein
MDTFQMNWRSIALSLAKKGLSVIVIHRDVVKTLSPETAAYLTVTRYLRMLSFRNKNKKEEIQVQETAIGEIDC